jgi:hypothetical protein
MKHSYLIDPFDRLSPGGPVSPQAGTRNRNIPTYSARQETGSPVVCIPREIPAHSILLIIRHPGGPVS